MTDLVIEKPLATKPLLQSAPKEVRSKLKHDPSKQKATAPAKPRLLLLRPRCLADPPKLNSDARRRRKQRGASSKLEKRQ